MVRFLISALVLSGLAVASAGYLSRLTLPQDDGRDDAPPTAASPPTAGRAVTLPADGRGHFAVEAFLGGQRLAMLVDTGATVVALRESDARRAGIFVTPGDFTATVSTANGERRAAPVTLDRVEIGPIRLSGIEAVVLPDAALASNLLGMSFMGRLSRFEAADGALVLVQ